MIELIDVKAGLVFRFDGRLYEALDKPVKKVVRVYRVGDGKEITLKASEVKKSDVVITGKLFRLEA